MAELDLELRLLKLHTAVTALLREHRPDVVAIERVFTQNNKGTAMGTAQAAGVAALAAAQADRPVAWHTPSEVKAAISGYGRADKEQVTSWSPAYSASPSRPKPADAADALALAVCHVWRGPAQHRPAPGRRLAGGDRRSCVVQRRPALRWTGSGGPMIASVNGRVAAVSPDRAVVEVGGIGLAVQVHAGHHRPAAGGGAARLATSLVVREDSLTLYGFADDDERSCSSSCRPPTAWAPARQAVLAIHPPRSPPRRVDGRRQGARSGCPASARRAPSAWSSSCATGSGDDVRTPRSTRDGAAGGVTPVAPWRDQLTRPRRAGLEPSGADGAVLQLARRRRQTVDGLDEVAVLLRQACSCWVAHEGIGRSMTPDRDDRRGRRVSARRGNPRAGDEERASIGAAAALAD